MIYNQWYAILESKEISKGKPITVKRLAENLVFWREQSGKLCCIIDRCCHRGASLGCGKVHGDNIECPFHGFQYDGNGRVCVIPANGKNEPVPPHYNVQSYLVKEAYGLVWLWYGEERTILPELPFFDDLKEGFSYATFKDHWNVHYSRAIENQLDVVHLPFVHYNTIGKGNKTLVNGPVVITQEDGLRFYVNNLLDDGKTKPLKPEQIKDYEKLFQLAFHFPNVWQNFIGDKLRVFAAFAPIDDENTMIYLRYYQSFMKFPVLKQLVNILGNYLDKIILRQDKRVVITQIPKKTSLKMGENLIQGDLPIVKYRQIREQLQELNKR